MGDIIILAALAAVVALAVRALVKQRRKGGCAGCSGGCAGCSGRCGIRKQ